MQVAVEEARRSVKELTEEIMFEKETTKNLNLQLCKMQAANMELVLEIEDLEKALEQQREENGIKKTHESPEASFQASSGDDYTPVATDTERKWHERLAEKEDETKTCKRRLPVWSCFFPNATQKLLSLQKKLMMPLFRAYRGW